jgi:dUTP pyrophosphatase
MQRRTYVKVNRVLDVPLPEYGTALSAGFDLATAEGVHLAPKESNVFRTGLIIQAPADHMLLVAPRSSTFRKWGVSLGNTVGIVDEDFCGPEDELRLYLHNPHAWKYTNIPAGTRLAQGVFVPIRRGVFQLVDEPIAATRGGWGSTGD